LAERRVRLLRGGRVHARAHAALLRAAAQRGNLALGGEPAAPLAQQLVDRRHVLSVCGLFGPLHRALEASPPGRPAGLPARHPRRKKALNFRGLSGFRQATCSLVVSASSRAKPKVALDPGSTATFLRVEW